MIKPKRRVIKVNFKYADEGREVWEKLVEAFGPNMAERIAQIVWSVQGKYVKTRNRETNDPRTKKRREIGLATRARVRRAVLATPKPWPKTPGGMSTLLLKKKQLGLEDRALRGHLKMLNFPNVE